MNETDISITSPADTLAMVPYLLGFHPEDSVVLIVTSENRVVVTARFDLALVTEPEQLRIQIRGITQGEGLGFICVTYSRTRDQGRAAQEVIEEFLGSDMVLGIEVWGSRYALYRCECASCELGEPIAESSECAQMASDLGFTALGTRSELEKLITHPDGLALIQARELWRKTIQEVQMLENPKEHAEFILDQLSERPPDDSMLITLGVLVHQISVRDHLWIKMRRETALESFELWRAVVHAVPDEHSVPALCLASMSAWLSGNGALQVICFTRAAELDRNYSMVDLLEKINLAALPPDAWAGLLNQYQHV